MAARRTTARRRKGWDALSAAQRRRYERAGITRRAYDAGASLTAARGHAQTPERPSRAERHPDRYRGYFSRRRKPMRLVSTAGVQAVVGLSDREASLVGRHDNAVRRYINTGRDDGLDRFDGVEVAGYELETRRNALDWLALTQQLSFESIYEGVA